MLVFRDALAAGSVASARFVLVFVRMVVSLLFIVDTPTERQPPPGLIQEAPCGFDERLRGRERSANKWEQMARPKAEALALARGKPVEELNEL